MSVEIIIGDALEELRKLPSDSVDCCITSPPYWGLRDYGVAGQLGLEPTLGEHLDALVILFEEVRRVLKPTGSLWLNYGDCYATAPNGRSAAATKEAGTDDRTFRDKPFSTIGPIYGAAAHNPNIALNGTGRRGGGNAPAGPILEQQPENRQAGRRGRSGNLGNGGINGQSLPAGRIVSGGMLKPKDLCMIPNRLAIALQDAGWWVRSEIIWGKPNAMPDSSGVYRPSGAHEKVWLLTKSGDADVWRARDTGAISFAPDLAERAPLITDPSRMGARWVRLGSYYDADAVRMAAAQDEVSNRYPGSDGDGVRKRSTTGNKRVAGWAVEGEVRSAIGANKPDKQRGHSRPHAGFNDRWDGMSRDEQTANGRLLRNYEADLSAIVQPVVWEIATASFSDAHFATFSPALVAPCVMAGCPKGGIVLDPFGGAGTTGLVADRLGRDAILIELNPEYAVMARDRLAKSFVRVESTVPRQMSAAGPLFGEEVA